MKILVGTAFVPFRRRSVDMAAQELCRTLSSCGHEARIVRVPVLASNVNRLGDVALANRLLDWRESGGAMGDALIALEFPAYLIRHSRKSIWLCEYWRAGIVHDPANIIRRETNVH